MTFFWEGGVRIVLFCVCLRACDSLGGREGGIHKEKWDMENTSAICV